MIFIFHDLISLNNSYFLFLFNSIIIFFNKIPHFFLFSLGAFFLKRRNPFGPLKDNVKTLILMFEFFSYFFLIFYIGLKKTLTVREKQKY